MTKPTLVMGSPVIGSLMLRALVAAVVCVAATVRADDAFREFPDTEVLRPVELFRTLLEMQNLPPELLEQARQMSANMSHSQPPPDMGFRFGQQTGPGGVNIPGSSGAPGKSPTSPPQKKQGTTPGSPKGPPAPPKGPGAPPGSPPPGSNPTSPFGPGGAPGKGPASPKQSNSPPRKRPSPSKTQQRSADRARSTANENFRQRMNRILLNAAREAAQRESDGEPRNALERLLEKAQKEVTEAVKKSSPETRRKWRKRFQQVGKNANGQRSADWLNSSRDESSGAPTPGARTSSWWPWLLLGIVALAIGAAVTLRRSKHAAAIVAARQRARNEKRVKSLIRGIQTHRELIDALDQLVLWRHGDEASSWDSTRVETMLRRGNPRSASQIEDLIHHYTLAKYSPSKQPLNREQLTHCAATLDALAETEWHAPPSQASLLTTLAEEQSE